MPEQQSSHSSSADKSGLWLLACLALIALGAVQRTWFLIDHCPFDLSGDEAHYWEWSRHLDWSYYSKGPLVAWIIAAGRALIGDWSRQMIGSEMLAVRFPAVLLSSITGVGIYVLALQTLRRPILAFASVALTATIPITAAGAILMTIDAPLACAWVWALVCIHRGLRTNSLIAWLAAGLLIAIGTLAKFNMVFMYAVVGLLLVCVPSLRTQWLRPGPWLAAIVGLAGWLPILWWNYQHGWVSFRHVAGQAGVAGKTTFNLLGPVDYFTNQAAVLGPIWLVGLLFALRAGWRNTAQSESSSAPPEPQSPPWSTRFLAIATAVPFAVFLLFSPITTIEPNWPAVGLISGAPLLVFWLSRGWDTPKSRLHRRWIIGSATAFGLTASVLAFHTDWLMPVFKWLAGEPRPWSLNPVAKYDPTARLRGWQQLGSAVGELLAAERAVGRDPVVMTDNYQVASEIAFYAPGNPPATCIQSILGKRQSQYDIWPNPIRDPALFLGRPVLYIGSRENPLLTGENGNPAAFENLRTAQIVEFSVQGAPLQVWGIHAADRFNGFPASVSQEKF